MFALIYDEHDFLKPQKKVITLHRSRETAEKALKKRIRALGRSVEECNTQIVWVKTKVSTGDYLTANDFETWRPNEKIPEGDLYSDTD